MKLLRIKLLEQFRSLPDNFEIKFISNGYNANALYQFMPYCLIGRNGSGKSNLLEAIAAIFYHIECMNLNTLPSSFVYDEEENPGGFTSDKASIDAFEIEYLFQMEKADLPNPVQNIKSSCWKPPHAHILITKEKGNSPVIRWMNRKLFEHNGDEVLTRLEAKGFFPNYVIGYSSGENEILSLPFFKMRFIHYDEYEQALQKKLPYTQPEGRLIYFDNSLSQAVFLTNYLMQDTNILNPIYKSLGIVGVSQFRIIIRLNEYTEASEFLNTDNEDGERDEAESSNRIKLTSRLDNLITVLKNCSTCWENKEDVLFLDYCIDDATKMAFASNFENDPIKLFQSFQILLTLNLFEVSYHLKKELYESSSLYVNETVPVLASDRRIMRVKDLEITTDKTSRIYNKSLSDGEHQFLHSMGVCLLFKNSNSLFLLDEPETHFNPEWRSLFISTLKECLQQKGTNFMSDILITSHSPFIVSDCLQSNVLVFERSNRENSKVKVTRPEFNTFGASVNLITNRLFHKEETISMIASTRLKHVLKDFKAHKISLEDAIKEANQLGDSVEKLLIVDQLRRSSSKKTNSTKVKRRK
ncbi:restriction system-associated AAA family ATPase [Chitinophaga lutea]|uniref:Restriction system-associated AAA family ATPase n=1 Tax=Chitinophaga lutea TaxID=2488634 RepID=A0A3N4PXA5_9BACT|nr:restriction system-associated AAA family ATPase [Chitinophaga lutea]RPE13453.1 restriction system-associated AAA family ATPase [Chitinophaga lutea]